MTSQDESTGTRPYRKRRRAESEVETRLRITEAAMKLHGTVGPAHTTIMAIADEAGVQRATVYRHFPDLEALFSACSTHWMALNPPPDPATWTPIADPDTRLKHGLTELYAWYAWAEPMLARVFRDAPSVPAMAQPVEDFRRYSQALHRVLMSGRKLGGRARVRVSAAVGHALAFATWQSLARDNELRPDEAVELMSRLVAAAAHREGALRSQNASRRQ